MAYRKKAKLISKYGPDFVIVPECEYLGDETAKNLWFGDNRKKGIGIFSYSDFELELNKDYDPSFKYVIPINVTGPIKFNLIATWAMNSTKDIRNRYIGQVYSAINYYKELLDKPTVIMGDFNWNAIWDIKPSYPLCGNLNNVVEILKNRKIKSAYHEFFNEDFGKETKPTFFMHHRREKSYHIDYCFASTNLEVSEVEVGDFDDWIKRSDHMPMVVNFKDNF
jgi:exodeoxyribonuclease III